MTIEQRAKLRVAIEKATDLNGANLVLDAEGYEIEKGGNRIAYFPLDCQPMSEADEAYNAQVRYNAWLFLSCRDNLLELLDEVEQAGPV